MINYPLEHRHVLFNFGNHNWINYPEKKDTQLKKKLNTTCFARAVSDGGHKFLGSDISGLINVYFGTKIMFSAGIYRYNS